MAKIRCKCTVCEETVDEWFNAMCMPCYHGTITAPYEEENVALRKENAALRSVLTESNQIWDSIVRSYRTRLSVRITDWFVRRVQFLLITIHMIVAAVKGVRHPITRFKKLH